MSHKKRSCSDCHKLDRRGFVKTVGGAALAGATAPVLFDPRFAHAAPTPTSAAETAVGRFYASLSEQQKKEICLPFNHEARSRISANWHVTEPLIGDDFYTKEQRATIDEIVRNITTPDGYERLQLQMDDDDGGMDGYSVAVFGQPGTGKFEWEMTGRHLTLRADGNSVDQAAFGGPIVYGHGEENPKDNLFYFQTKRANEVFQALDPKQSERALLTKAPRESAVELQGNSGSFPGLGLDELSDDQKELVEATLKVLLAPYRNEDVEEVMSILKNNGGLDQLHMAFYQEDDLESDKVWDIWRIEGPALVWHFRGASRARLYQHREGEFMKQQQILSIVVASVALLLTAAQVAEAQNRGRRFGGVSHVQLASLDEVQEELKLTDEQKAKAEELNEELRGDMRDAFQAVRDAGGGFMDMREKMQKLRQKASANFVEVLQEPQLARLHGIFVQVNGPGALSHKDTAAALKLSDEQKQKLKDVTAESWDETRDAFEDLQDVSREERIEKMVEIRDKTDKQLLAVLTTEQTDAFEKIKGEEIELDLSQLFQRRN